MRSGCGFRLPIGIPIQRNMGEAVRGERLRLYALGRKQGKRAGKGSVNRDIFGQRRVASPVFLTHTLNVDAQHRHGFHSLRRERQGFFPQGFNDFPYLGSVADELARTFRRLGVGTHGEGRGLSRLVEVDLEQWVGLGLVFPGEADGIHQRPDLVTIRDGIAARFRAAVFHPVIDGQIIPFVVGRIITADRTVLIFALYADFG